MRVLSLSALGLLAYHDKDRGPGRTGVDTDIEPSDTAIEPSDTAIVGCRHGRVLDPHTTVELDEALPCSISTTRRSHCSTTAERSPPGTPGALRRVRCWLGPSRAAATRWTRPGS